MSGLTILIGPSGCGKSAWARHHSGAAEVFGSDTLREQRFGTNQDHSADAEIMHELDCAVIQALTAGRSVVVEDGLIASRRLLHIRAARSAGALAHAVVFENIDEARERNRARERSAPEEMFEAQRRLLEQAMVSVWDEGYDSILWVGEYSLLSSDFSDTKGSRA